LTPYGPLLESVRGLTWPARRRAGGALPGVHVSRLRGAAPELSEYRLYRQGDDPRRLDWKLLARSDRAYIRLAEDRAILATWFVIDASASMAGPAPLVVLRRRRACELVVALASIALAARATTSSQALASIALAAADPVGLIAVHGAGVVRLPARARRGAVRGVAAALREVTPAGSPPLAPVLGALRPGARVVLLSDFLGDERDLLRASRGLGASGGDVHAVHIVAREELDPPRRVARAVDPEDHAVARPLDDGSRDTYLARFAEWRGRTAHEWRRAGAAWTEVSTAEDPVHAVRRIVGAGAAPAASVRTA